MPEENHKITVELFQCEHGYWHVRASVQGLVDYTYCHETARDAVGDLYYCIEQEVIGQNKAGSDAIIARMVERGEV